MFTGLSHSRKRPCGKSNERRSKLNRETADAKSGEATILVVDDDREIADSVAKILEKEGYITLTANDGMQALETIASSHVDLIILDIMMPRLDGLSATMKIREKKNIPIIILSAKTEDSDKVLGLSMGADD